MTEQPEQEMKVWGFTQDPPELNPVKNTFLGWMLYHNRSEMWKTCRCIPTRTIVKYHDRIALEVDDREMDGYCMKCLKPMK